MYCSWAEFVTILMIIYILMIIILYYIIYNNYVIEYPFYWIQDYECILYTLQYALQHMTLQTHFVDKVAEFAIT